MSMQEFMFMLLSGIIIVFSILTVTSRRILRAAVFLLFVLIATSGIYFMLNYQFLAAVQLTLYAGGIVVLIIFSILLTSHINEKFKKVGWKKLVFSAIASVAGIILSVTTILQYKFLPATKTAMEVNMQKIGTSLMSVGHDGYLLPFEVISILLLAAMIGSIVIAKKHLTK